MSRPLLEPVGAGQTRFRMQGLSTDARGIAVGREVLITFPTIDWLVAFLGAYSDEASLLADVAGLDATATSINGQPLVWPAAPHFWSKGGVLVLAVTDDQEFVDLISQVLGTPFAGQP